jgi:hypothetical protein
MFWTSKGSPLRVQKTAAFWLSQDLGLEKQKRLESNPGAFSCNRTYDQTVTEDAFFCVFFRATASSKPLKTLVSNICKYSVKDAPAS